MAATAPTSLLTLRDHKLFCPLHTLHASPKPSSLGLGGFQGKIPATALSFTWAGAETQGSVPTLPSVEPPTLLSRGRKGRRHLLGRLGPGTFITWRVGGRGAGEERDHRCPGAPGAGGGGAPAGPSRRASPEAPASVSPRGEGLRLSQLGPALLLSESRCATRCLAPAPARPRQGSGTARRRRPLPASIRQRPPSAGASGRQRGHTL